MSDQMIIEDSESDFEVLGSTEDIDPDFVDRGVPEEELNHIPYSRIHSPPEPFKSQKRKVWIPGKAISIKIIEAVRQPTKDIANPNVYVIEIEHGGYSWQVRRRHKHFGSLHNSLLMYRTQLHIPTTAAKRSQAKGLKKQLPKFPRQPDGLVSPNKMEERKRQLEDYLQSLVRFQIYRNHPETLDFFEVSQLSFVDNLGSKMKEGMMKKRRGGHKGGCFSFITLPGPWKKRWFVVKDTYVTYVRPEDGVVSHLLLMDSGFKVQAGHSLTTVRHGVLITNNARELLLTAWTHRKALEWEKEIKQAMETTGKEFIEPIRFGSYAPVRPESYCRCFVDGAGYFDAVAEGIEMAKEEIFVTDWWLSPELYLKRPALGDKYRFDLMLKRKADEGVKVFVLLYKEVEMALGINSAYSKICLTQKHPENIIVMRHPDHVPGGTFLWAHHEKMVVIDQRIAFFGGLDVCYARWDTHQHRLTDLGQGGPFMPGPDSIKVGLQGSGLTNLLVNLAGLGNGQEQQIEHAQSPDSGKPESPITDEDNEAPGSTAVPARNLSTYEDTTDSSAVKRRNKYNPKVAYQRLSSRLKPATELKRRRSLEAGRFPVFEEHGPPKVRGAFEVEPQGQKLWIGKDYSNFMFKDFADLDAPFTDLIDRHQCPRMPWHDIGACVYGKPARDLARHFIQRWNQCKIEKAKFESHYPLLLPKSYDHISVPRHFKDTSVKCTAQMLRSVSTWSIGVERTEDSIHQAYLSAIRESKHFIYIENQFFVTHIDREQVKNSIALALYERIKQAHAAEENFRVYVVMPVLPGFEGEVGAASGYAIQAICHWQYTSICRGGNSLMERLTRDGVPAHKYITFHGLRTHSEINGTPITELIYVHSKMLIVDDRICIIGSANINDRSLIGDRDSEVACIFEDTEFTPCLMDGMEAQCGRLVGPHRKLIFRELLGLIEAENGDDIVSDPCTDEFYKSVWLKTASVNTESFEKAFHCYPADSIRSYEQLEEYKKETSLVETAPDEAREIVKNINGYLILLPTMFLADSELQPPPTSKEGLVPVDLWI